MSANLKVRVSLLVGKTILLETGYDALPGGILMLGYVLHMVRLEYCRKFSNIFVRDERIETYSKIRVGRWVGSVC